MDTKPAEVTLHIDKGASPEEHEKFRNALSAMEGVLAAAGEEKRPHLMLIEYNPDGIDSIGFVNTAKEHGLHGELIGFQVARYSPGKKPKKRVRKDYFVIPPHPFFPIQLVAPG